MNKTEAWYMQGDPWELVQQAEDSKRNIYYETILCQANGYLGVRAYPEEGEGTGETCREGYLAGVFSAVDEEAARIINGDFPWPVLEMVSLPDLFHTRIRLGGVTFLPEHGSVRAFRRRLDLRTGLLTRELQWTDQEGRTTRLTFERFLSAANPHLACQRVAVTPLDWSGEVAIERALEGDGVTRFRCGDRNQPHLPQRHFEDHCCRTVTNSGTLTVKTRETGHSVAFASVMPSADTQARGNTGFVQSVTHQVEAGNWIASERFAAVAHSRDQAEEGVPTERAAEAARQAAAVGFDAVYAENSTVWEQRWETGNIEIEGHARDEKVIRYNIFQLLQMAPFHADNLSLPARAYAYNRYRGLYFWDTEIFLLPFYQWVFPDVARNLLTFRHRTLPGARRNAEHWGGCGALYPWMTDSDSGLDNSIDARVWKLLHQGADIAFAVDQYEQTSGDKDFMAARGLEILVEVARFFASRLELGPDGRRHLEQTIGPDEDHAPGRDNGFTCLMARRALRIACRRIKQLDEAEPVAAKSWREYLEIRDEEPESWEQLATNLNVPTVPDTDIPLQDEFLLSKKTVDVAARHLREPKSEWITPPEPLGNYRLIKQADIVLAAFLLEDEFSAEQRGRIYDFYEPMTLHASSLSWNTHAIVAARLGRAEHAYEYYLKSAGLDLDNVKDSTADGLHAAALGGGWQTVVLGICGLRMENGSPVCDPQLPAKWSRVRFRIRHDGSTRTITAEADGRWTMQ
ncbi:MAG: hypothetical protein ACOCUY_00835 [Verrucomicrobiota bacterium]